MMSDENAEAGAESQEQSPAGAVADLNNDLDNDKGGDAVSRPDYVPEKFWDADKGEARVEDALKSYGELEKRFGSFTGAPEEYEVSLSDELAEQGVSIADDDPMIAQAKEFAKEMNMNQEGFGKMVELHAMTQLAEQKAAEDYKEEQFKALGDNADRRVENVLQWASHNMTEQQFEGLKEATNSAAAFEAVESLIAMTRSAPAQASEAAPTSGVTTEEVQTMQFAKDEHGNRKIAVDPAYRAEYERKRDLLYGTGDYNQVIGG